MTNVLAYLSTSVITTSAPLLIFRSGWLCRFFGICG